MKKQYRHMMERVTLGEDKKEEIMNELKETRPVRRFARPLRTALIAACACLALVGTAFAAEAVQTARFNAAVAYLTSLGIQAEDLSDYSRQEVIHAYECMDAGKGSELVDSILPSNLLPARPSEPADVTSDQIRQLTPTMTLEEVTSLLGDTVDVGSGLCILLYRVDGAYTLTIPFAGLDAQLGVSGETLLEALQPIAE